MSSCRTLKLLDNSSFLLGGGRPFCLSFLGTAQSKALILATELSSDTKGRRAEEDDAVKEFRC